MDRKDEILELTARLVSLILEEREEMRQEIEKLREAVEKLGMNTPSAITLETAPEVADESKPEFEVEYETERQSEPETGSEFEQASELTSPGLQDPDSQVLRPRNRQEQMEDTTDWGGNLFNSDLDMNLDDDLSDEPLFSNLFEEEKLPVEPRWMTDVPGPGVRSVYEALSNNDRIMFIRELFDEDGEQFALSMDRIDECADFGQVVKEMRIAFPEWDEGSDAVYNFYMTVRRKFN